MWTSSQGSSASHLCKPLIQEDSLAGTSTGNPEYLDPEMSVKDKSGQATQALMSAEDNLDSVVVQSPKNKDRSKGARSTKSGHKTKKGHRSKGSHNGGITQRTQIRVTKRSSTLKSSWKLKYHDVLPTLGKTASEAGTHDTFS